MNKIDLTLLNRLVKELNDMVRAVEEMPQPTDLNSDCEYVTVLSKTLGVATGISYEASGVVGDILKVIKNGPTPSRPEDILSSMFGGEFKMPKN